MKVTKSTRVVPPHREVAILLDKDTLLLEDGEEWPYDLAPMETKVYASRSVISQIFMREKVGEVLKYDGDILKWRKECPPRYKSRATWRNDPKEVNVVGARNFPENPFHALEAYADWRDWIESYGGNIIGTMSSSAWSLFKMSLPSEVWFTPYDGVPGIDHPIGGRLLPCKDTWTTFQGDLIQWDLHSAYTRRLAGLAFGGKGSHWREVRTTTNFDRLVEKGYCVYIEARVKFNGEGCFLGPLPKRRTEYHPRPITNIGYPTKGTIQGIWTYEEIRDADRVGTSISIQRAFIHIATGSRYHHANWYNTIQEGRRNLEGFAKGLAKQTGNSLWGRYAMRIRPAKTVYRDNDGNRKWIKHPDRTLKRNQCMELADQLSGKIRSDLFEFAISADNNLLQGNTDGAWVVYKEGWLPPSDDWRIKKRANRMDIIDDATYRYWEEGEEGPTYIVPGVNTDFVESHFDKNWAKHHAM